MSDPSTSSSAVAPDAGLPRAFGSFALLRAIATGQRGQVFAALRPVEIERFCALKILNEGTERQPDFVHGLRNEATRVVRRIHGNLVQIYDVGLVDQRLFFVSELLEGTDLATLQAELKRRRQPFPVDVAVFVAMEIAAALSYLRRLAARTGEGEPLPGGLTPRSVLLSVDGEVKLLHYGATMAALPARDAFVPPERGAATPGATDAYLLGALLRSMLAGAPALTAPPPLVRLIERATAADPTARPADADDVRTSLAAVLRSLKGPAALPPVGELVRGSSGAAAVDRGALAAIAKSYDPKRGASPPTWKVITLTRLETGGVARPVRAPAAPIDLGAGKVIPGTRYRILSKIGEGGMGSVYLAEHVDLEKRVALKLLRADVAPSPETLQQFRHEARAASKVGSAYICDVTDFGELADGRVFFVMEHLDGQSLGRVLRQLSRIEPARAIPILRQVA
jgi:serine/threonine-protein kinase